MMNSLEMAVMRGARKAHHEYESMTAGYWLSHAPESYLQHKIANEIYRTGHTVYVDAALKKSRKDADVPFLRGRPPVGLRRRPDITVWHKSSDTLRAIIEIKLAYNSHGILRDGAKIDAMLSQRFAAKTGYILAYSEAKGSRAVSTLGKRFGRWADGLGWQLVNVETGGPDSVGWCWGVALYRRCDK